jgi:hypothetical protein
LQAEKESGRETSRGETNGHKSEDLVSVLALGPSACPKNARDLTFQPFVGIVGANQSSCFVLSGGVIGEDSAGIWKFVGSPGVEADFLFPRLHLQTRPVFRRRL